MCENFNLLAIHWSARTELGNVAELINSGAKIAMHLVLSQQIKSDASTEVESSPGEGRRDYFGMGKTRLSELEQKETRADPAQLTP
ncbi:hypothetical protein CYJ42_10060 [Corynebacterium amycolatum]|nr:hypothetical protein CYJ42_10060 [Corynebacterium amycolatum]